LRTRASNWGKTRKEFSSVVFVEARPQINDDGSPIADYVIDDHADQHLRLSERKEGRSTGPKRTVTGRTLPEFVSGTIAKNPTIGGRLDVWAKKPGCAAAGWS